MLENILPKDAAVVAQPDTNGHAREYSQNGGAPNPETPDPEIELLALMHHSKGVLASICESGITGNHFFDEAAGTIYGAAATAARELGIVTAADVRAELEKWTSANDDNAPLAVAGLQLWDALEKPDTAPDDAKTRALELSKQIKKRGASTREPKDKAAEPKQNAELTPEEIRRIFREKAREYSEPLTLDEVKARFKNWLYIEDEGLLEVYLGAIAANLMPGDPVWLMIVGASGGGKTEPLNAAIRLAFVHLAATVTESSLLSGTPKREKAKDAKGGLLREVGPFGLLLLKDFTSMLAQRRDASAAVLSAFREIYDGSWTRHVGSDGGTALHWSGKLAVIAGCTDTIDSHTAVIGTMGERFAFYRLPAVDDRKLSRHALQMAGKEAAMRDELSRAVCGLFAGLTLPDSLPEISEEDLERLIDLASLTARCRSAVERDNHTRDITLTLSPEAPTRIAKILRQLFHGMDAIGVERPRIWAALEKIAFDSMHKVRRAVLKVLEDGELHSTPKIAAAIQYPTVTTRRALEELHAHDVLIRARKAEGNSDAWQFSDWTAQTLAAVKSPKADEEKSVPVFQTDDISFSSLEEDDENEGAAEYMHPEKRERFQNVEIDPFDDVEMEVQR
jgi:hypothetical protein